MSPHLDMDEDFRAAAKIISEADAILIGAGAGMGVASGLPDFRGEEGFWKAYPIFRQSGLRFKDLANPRGFTQDPQQAWGFYGHRLNLYIKTIPHSGFEILSNWAEQLTSGAFVYTSNVDGQFLTAGFDKAHLVECHGSIHHLQCSEGCSGIWETPPLDLQVDEITMRAQGELPRCSECKAVARPNILMFGDWDWMPQRTNAQEERLSEWMGQQVGKHLVVIECGAGTAIPTVRRMCEQAGGKLIRINLRETQVPNGHIGLSMDAQKALLGIDDALNQLSH